MKKNNLKKYFAALLAAAVTVSSVPVQASPAQPKTQSTAAVEEAADVGTFQVLSIGGGSSRAVSAHIRVITPGGVFVHKSRSTDTSTRIGFLAYGDTAEIIETNANWVRIYFHGYSSAWVCGTTDTGEVLTETLTDVLSPGYTELHNTEALITASNGVNVHTVAGLQYKVIALLPYGTIVDALSASDTWIRVKFKNGYIWEQGFISREWAKLIEKGQDTPPVSDEKFTGISGKNVLVKTNNKPLNVHISPSTNSRVITALKNGSQVTAIAQSPSWYEISYHDAKSGRIVSGYVSKLFTSLVASTGSTRMNKTKVTLRAGKKYPLAILGLNALQIKNISWRSANAKVATVTANGSVTAKKAGKAYVYAYYKVGTATYRLRCVVTVRK